MLISRPTFILDQATSRHRVDHMARFVLPFVGAVIKHEQRPSLFVSASRMVAVGFRYRSTLITYFVEVPCPSDAGTRTEMTTTTTTTNGTSRVPCTVLQCTRFVLCASPPIVLVKLKDPKEKKEKKPRRAMQQRILFPSNHQVTASLQR